MSEEVLYRKWRPPSFGDIVGQGPITQTLTQAIATGRNAHAYLLCGPRGTGKTSTARVLAKALNCTNRPEGVGDPCGVCNACTAIDKGSFVDLIEIDAASNRGIDEMRDLREKVRFSPALGGTKVYIIDEAHALTTDAFNAFLKTLEEPPPQTVFILATTEPHRLPATIISRCQRFDFHRISPADVIGRLTEISKAEGVDVSPEVLRTVARTAGGSLRDATNTLDQLITSFGAHVSLEQVQELLGVGGEERAVALVKHLLEGNTSQALELINRVASDGIDLRPLHRMAVDFLRAALLMKSGVKDALELSKEAESELSFATSRVSLEHILRALRLFGSVSLKFDQPSPLPLELATVELSLEPAPAASAAQASPVPAPANVSPQPRPAQAPTQPPVQAAAARPQAPPRAPQPQAPQQPYRGNGAQATPARPAPAVIPDFDPSAPLHERLVAQWPAILRAMSRVPRKRFDVAALLRSSHKRKIDGNSLVVSFTHVSNSERLQTELDDARCRIEVEKVLEQALGESFSLRVEAEDDQTTASREADAPGHLVRAAMSLGGQVVENAEVAAPAAEPEAPTEEAPTSEAPVAEAEPIEEREPTAAIETSAAEEPTEKPAPAEETRAPEPILAEAASEVTPVEPEPPLPKLLQPDLILSEPTTRPLFGQPNPVPPDNENDEEPVLVHVPSANEPAMDLGIRVTTDSSPAAESSEEPDRE